MMKKRKFSLPKFKVGDLVCHPVSCFYSEFRNNKQGLIVEVLKPLKTGENIYSVLWNGNQLNVVPEWDLNEYSAKF